MSHCKRCQAEYEGRCKTCHNAQQVRYRSADKAAEQARRAKHYLEWKARTAEQQANPKKQCSNCGESKILKKFVSRKDTKDGYSSECYVCRSSGDRERAAAKAPAGVIIHLMDEHPRHREACQRPPRPGIQSGLG